MQSLGQDIVICSEDTNTKYNYWVESCFNTTTTDVWFRVASLPNGNSIFYIYYGNSSASSPTEAQTYTGSAIFMYSGSVPSGFTNHALMNGKYPRANTTYGGNSGSISLHDHILPSTQTAITGYAQSGGGLEGAHAHGVSFVTTTGSGANSQSLPPTLALVFFTGSEYSGNNYRLTSDGSQIPINTISFYSGSSTPTNWSSYTPLINMIPSGSAADCTSGSVPHTHYYTGTVDAAPNNTIGSAGTTDLPTTSHTHTLSGTTSGSDAWPNYFDVYVMNSTAATNIPTNSITMFTALPPYGWSQLTIDNLRYPRGYTSYGTSGSAHTHGVPATTTSTDASRTGNLGGGGAVPYVSWNHNHNYWGVTGGPRADYLPYVDVIMAVKVLASTLTITVGTEEGTTITIPTRGYTPYTPTYASAFAFIETPRTASANATEWEIRLNSGNRLSSYKITIADRIGEFRNNVTKFDPIRLWIADGCRFDLLMWGIIEDHDQIQQESTTFTLSGRNLGALLSYRAANYNWYDTDVYNIITSGNTALSGSAPDLVWGAGIKSPAKNLTVLGEKRKALDVFTEIAQRVSDTTHTWLNYVCAGEHADEERQPNIHFEQQQTIPSEVFLTPRDVIGYELLESSRSSIQKLQVEYAQQIVSGSTFWLVSGSDFANLTDDTVAARTEKGTPFTTMQTKSDYLYIGNQDRFWKLFIDVSGSSIYTGSGGVLATKWEYSKFGTGSTNTGSWGVFTVSDETYGFNVDGETAFNVPVDWATGSFVTGSASSISKGITATGSASGSYSGRMEATRLTSVTSTLSADTISFYAHKTGSARLGIYNSSGSDSVATIGDTSGYNAAEGNNTALGYVVVIPSSGVIQSIGILWSGSGATDCKVALYASGSGKPTTLITQGVSTVAVGTWQDFPVTPVSIAAGTYFLSFCVSAATRADYYKVAAIRSYYTCAYASYPQSSWSGSISTQDNVIDNMRATLTSIPQTKLWESNSTTITTGSSATGSINTVNISAGTPTTLSLTSGSYWLAWQAGDANIQGSYTYQANSGSYATQTYGSFPTTWPNPATGSHSGSTLYVTDNIALSEYFGPSQYWVRVSTTGSATSGSLHQVLLASLYPSVWRSTGSDANYAQQYEYVYRGDIIDSGSAITYADTILSQVYAPMKVQRIVMRGSTYWRPTYTYYWRDNTYSGSGRYRLSTVIHRRSLEGYTSVLESSRLN